MTSLWSNIHVDTESQLPSTFRYEVRIVMGNKKLLLPGTSKIKFRRNPFVVFVYCLRYMCIPNSSFLALLASKLGYLWRINRFRLMELQIIILNYNPLFFSF